MANLLVGVDRLEGSNDLVLRAESPGATAYYQDGLPLRRAPLLPFTAIQRITTFVDHIPSMYGKTTAGVVHLETRARPSEAFFGEAEAFTSEVLDPYGHNLGALTLGGPLSDNLHVVAHAAFSAEADSDPRAIRTPRLSNAAQNALDTNPQVLELVHTQTGATDYLAFPGDLPEGLTVDEVLAGAAIPVGFQVTTGIPLDAATLITSSSFTTASKRLQTDAQTARFYGSLLYTPTPSLDLHLSGQHWTERGHAFDPVRTLFNADRMPKTRERTTLIQAKAHYTLSERMAYSLRAHISQRDGVQYDPAFSDNVEDIFFYGDIDHPANAFAQRYRALNGMSYERAFQDGGLPGRTGINALFASPASGGLQYRKEQETAFRFDASMDANLGFHNLTFGLTFEQQKERRFDITPAGLAIFYEDDTLESGTLPEDRVMAYTDLSYDQVGLVASYYGYNYLGTTSVENQDVDAFSAGATRNPLAPQPAAADFHVAPFTPFYYALYGSDRLRYLNFDLDIGLRVDVSGSNGLALKDPFAMYPILRAGDVTGATIPPNIGKTDAVYFNGQDDIIGYRDTDGRFFDPAGQSVPADQVTRFGQVRVQTAEQDELLNRVTSSVLETPTPQVAIQPRIAARFELDEETILFAHYNVLARRPRAFEYETIQGYVQAIQLPDLPTLNNPNLKPERTVSIGLGFEREMTGVWTMQASAYFRTLEDRIGLRFVDAFPRSYLTYDNVHDASVQGVDLVSVFEPLAALRLVTQYSFLNGRGTNAAATIMDELFPPNVINIARPSRSLDHQRQHMLKFLLTYAADEYVPTFLKNTHLSLFAEFKSGLPYTAAAAPTALFNTTVGATTGDINNERTPLINRIDLKIERQFALQEHLNLTAYLWVTNLLDSENVLSVYRFSGEADTDGWLATAPDAAARPRAFRDQYEARLQNPLHYGVPRQIRLGFRLQF